MTQDEELEYMITWAKEEKQSDCAELLTLIKDRCKDKKILVLEENGETMNFIIDKVFLHFKRPFPDFDILLFYQDENGAKIDKPLVWNYTYMHMIKKLKENTFSIEADGNEFGERSTERKSSIIRLKE